MKDISRQASYIKNEQATKTHKCRTLVVVIE